MTEQVHTIGGRPCHVRSLGRVRSQKDRSFYNLMSVTFLDTNEHLSMGAGEFARWSAKLDREHKKAVRS